MGFVRTTQQLSSIVAGAKVTELTPLQLKAMVDWLGANPLAGTKSPFVSQRFYEASVALRFSNPTMAEAKSTQFWWAMQERCQEFGLEGHLPDPNGGHLKAFDDNLRVEWAPDEIIPPIDVDGFVKAIEEVVAKSGGSVIHLVPDSCDEYPVGDDDRKMSVRFQLPDGRTVIYDAIILEGLLHIGLENDKEVGDKFDIPDQYNRATLEWLDVVLTAMFVRTMSRFTDISQMPKESSTGFAWKGSDNRASRVYILHSDDFRVKVGISRNVRSRIRTLCTGGGFKAIEAFCTPPIVNAAGIDGWFKGHFAAFNTNGEWFDITPKEAVNFIENASWLRDSEKRAYAWKREDEAFATRGEGFIRAFFPIPRQITKQ